ncbi:hypothetical protein QBC34DRAFT_453807 [Podospora aff. communis PSN243]|uniref:Thioredoxin-like fold domain-containing protein n=1 Tax=Podospora aff. communis PSN243 TaxID=3040156 RepID=A0AAV9H979_9PEZI|nr:hypothetical protein QBC34DRAFT_453807 [Podospora aff. communis PSN243]
MAKNLPPIPRVGDRAPWCDEIPFPSPKPVLLVFLRHCGDPFAEKTFNLLTSFSTRHPDISCIAVSHSPREATEKWIVDVGGEWEVEVVVDEERRVYKAWGLGEVGVWHEFNPRVLVRRWILGRDEGIWGTEEQTGTRWQVGGAFGVDTGGWVRWVKEEGAADDLPDFDKALKALKRSKTGLA